MKYDHNYWLKSEEEMQAGFKDILNKTETDRETALKKYALYLEAMNNTQVIANMVEDVTLGSSTPLMPKLPNSNNTKKDLDTLMQLTDHKFAYEMLETLIDYYVEHNLESDKKRAFKTLSSLK